MGLGAEPLVESREKSPCEGQGAKPPEAESFLFIFIQKWEQKLRIYMKACPRV